MTVLSRLRGSQYVSSGLIKPYVRQFARVGSPVPHYCTISIVTCNDVLWGFHEVLTGVFMGVLALHIICDCTGYHNFAGGGRVQEGGHWARGRARVSDGDSR